MAHVYKNNNFKIHQRQGQLSEPCNQLSAGYLGWKDLNIFIDQSKTTRIMVYPRQSVRLFVHMANGNSDLLCLNFQTIFTLWNICVTNDHGYVPLVVNTSRPFSHSCLITGFVTRLTRRVPQVEQELLCLP